MHDERETIEQAHVDHRSSLAHFGARLRGGQVTAEATARMLLDRIERENDDVQAFTAIDADRAMAAARAADLCVAAGVDLGPLMGVPLALKDLYAVDGLPMTAGSRVDVQTRVPSEGPLVRTLKRGGAVILGKTRTTEFAFGTFNPTHPTPRNPADRAVRRMPGGSSSGSAAAVGADLCFVGFGTDTGGSVRQPAALCGVAGFKATAGRLSMDGVFPLSPTFDSPGWFAHRVDDLALVWATLSGEERVRPPALDTLVFGRPDAHFFEGLEPAVANAVNRAERALQDAGVRIVSVTLPPLGELDAAFGAYLAAELVAHLGRERVVTSLSAMDPVVRMRIAPGLDLAAAEFLSMRARFIALAEAARVALSGVDAVITPACPRLAAPVAEYADPAVAANWSRETLRFTRPGNLFGLCGISLPIATEGRDALPVGLQLLARGGDDSRLLAIASVVESIIGRQHA
jgi:aspartyl-tRNA(Asn)/glutamyl-tRNA(Gln) amidotransferase subunit A